MTRIEGIAQNAKLSAAVVHDEQVVYCLDRTRWATNVEGKPTIVEGIPEHTDDSKSSASANGEISQGTAGGNLVIRTCRGWVGDPPSSRHTSSSMGSRQTRKLRMARDVGFGGTQPHTFEVLAALPAIDGASSGDIRVLVEIP